MEEQQSFFDSIRLALRSRGFEDEPYELLVSYQFILDQFQDSYEWNIEEFDNDISIRSIIEVAVLQNEELQRFEELNHFRAKVYELDDKLKQKTFYFCRSPRLPWWMNRILKKAGSRYSEDVKRIYAIDLENPDTGK